MFREHRSEYPSLRMAVESFVPKIGCVPQALLARVKQHEIDADTREGVTTAEAGRVKGMVREIKELRRASETLKLASAFSPRRSSTAGSSPEGPCRCPSRHLRG